MEDTPETKPDEVRCAECGTLLGEGQDRETTEGGVFCRHCFDALTAQLRQAIAAQGSDVNYSMAVVGALGGGALGAAVWWGFTVLTGIAFGLVAVVIGITVGKGIVMLTGGKRSVNLQVLSVVVAAGAFVCGTYFVNRTLILRQFAEQGIAIPLLPDPALFFEVLRAGFGFMDVLFLAIAIYEAWKIPAPVRMSD